MKRILTILMLAGVALAVVPQAKAGLQTDTILNGGTNVVISATTNTYRGTSGNVIFIADKTTDVIFEFSATTTNANALTAGATTTFTLDAAANASHSDLWVTNALIFNVVNLGAANKVAVTLTNLPKTQLWPYYRVGEAWNTNLSGTNWTGLKVRAFTKDRE
jgi:hypothetical protein